MRCIVSFAMFTTSSLLFSPSLWRLLIGLTLSHQRTRFYFSVTCVSEIPKYSFEILSRHEESGISFRIPAEIGRIFVSKDTSAGLVGFLGILQRFGFFFLRWWWSYEIVKIEKEFWICFWLSWRWKNDCSVDCDRKCRVFTFDFWDSLWLSGPSLICRFVWMRIHLSREFWETDKMNFISAPRI